MTFPSVSSADSKSGTVTSNSTSWTLTYPTNIVANDLLLAYIGADGTPTATWPANWVSDLRTTSANALHVGKKKADGSETGNFTVTMSASEQGAWRVIRIPASQWEGTLGTTWINIGSTEGSVSWDRTITGSPSSSPDPPSTDPANWGTEDTLWIALAASDSTVTYSTFPTNYTQEDHTTAGGHASTSGGANGAGLAVAYRQLNAASENPGTFGLSGSEDWAAATIAVRPAAVAAAASFIFRRRPNRGLIVR